MALRGVSTASGKPAMVTLVVNPGTDSQRALYVVKAHWDRGWALEKAREKHGDAPMGWLDHETKELVAV